MTEYAANTSLLERALEFEDSGRKYYREAQEKAGNPHVKELFGMLIEEEGKHYSYLRDLFIKLKSNGLWPDESTIDLSRDFKMIFKEAAEKMDENIEYSQNEIESLEYAKELELKGKSMYEDLSIKADSMKEKDLYEKLAQWEQGHADMIDDYLNYFHDHGMRTQGAP